MTPSAESRLGGCLCGRVRYRVQGTPTEPSHCHCETCRRASGAAFVSWASFPAAGFAYTAGQPARFDSSEAAYREFCAHCGTQLTFRLHAEPTMVDVTLCSLDEPESITPADHIWTRRQLHWVKLADGLPAFPEKRSKTD